MKFMVEIMHSVGGVLFYVYALLFFYFLLSMYSKNLVLNSSLN